MALLSLCGWILAISARVLLWLVRVVGGTALLVLRPKRRRSHGSARWASWFSMLKAGALSHKGLIVAHVCGRFIRYKGDGAVLVYAPMGAGKTSGLVLPALLDRSPRSVICTDPKGELAAIAGRWRAGLGPVWRLDALHPDTSHRFNPLDLVRVGTHHEADDAAMIADLLVVSESSDQHWDSSAKQLITALIRHTLHSFPRELRTLSTIRELIANEGEALVDLLQAMAQSPLTSVSEEGRITLSSLGTPEMTSILKNTAKAMAFWSRDRVGGMLTSASDFSLLNMHIKTKTVFIGVPEDKLATYKPFLRMMMGCALAAAVRGKEYPAPKCKPLLLIDECPALGYLEALASGLGYLRAYARVLLVFQDLGQLKRIYGAHGARTFMAAAGCQVAYNVNDNETAHELAESIGRTTVLSISRGQSRSGFMPWDTRETRSESETGRYHIDASEIRRLHPARCVVLITGCLPILAWKVRHFRVRHWRKRWDAWRARDPASAAAA
jgi:type IV secretion system protein VirD4